MLKRLSITNLAIIENVDVTFKDGFTVLTGETGAGKSLVIDSLSLLLGARASSELIRTGEDKATIKGVFSCEQPTLIGTLSKLGIAPDNNNEITIERCIGKNKSSIKINGSNISLTDLNHVARILADIHSQFDFAKILNPDNYLEMIDGLSSGLVSPYLADYQEALASYREKKRDYESLMKQKQKLDEDRDFCSFQYKELKNADLREGEESDIASEISLLRNYDKVYSIAQEANEIIHGDFLDQLYELNQRLAKLAEYQKDYEGIHATLDDRYYEIDDALTTLKKKFQNMDYDPERLNYLEQRDSDLASLKRKYKKTIPELIAYRDELSSLLGEGSNFEEKIAAAKEAMDCALEETFAKGQNLSTVRNKVAKSLEKELTRHLKDLMLEAKFQVYFMPIRQEDGDALLRDNGIDQIDFLIETNIGEGMKSLSKVVSGGEASRLMLAIKAVFIKANKVDTVIFDEIDTGISGEAASRVARKIQEISLSSQVIAITHTPQVASLSDHHILISKEVKNGRTYSHMKELSLNEKVQQVAYLISGGKVTEKQMAVAQEMVLSK